MQNKTIILEDSPNAAVKETIEVWKSAKGNYYLTEESARIDGRTHIHCRDCNEIVELPYVICNKCRAKRNNDAYLSRTSLDWDYMTPIYSEEAERYFNNEEELLNYCDEYDHKPEDLQLLLCEPIYAEPIDYEYYYSNSLPDDSNLPTELEKLFIELNEKIEFGKYLLGYEPSKFSVKQYQECRENI